MIEYPCDLCKAKDTVHCYGKQCFLWQKWFYYAWKKVTSKFKR